MASRPTGSDREPRCGSSHQAFRSSWSNSAEGATSSSCSGESCGGASRSPMATNDQLADAPPWPILATRLGSRDAGGEGACGANPGPAFAGRYRIYADHAQIGAERLRGAGAVDLATIVAEHHAPHPQSEVTRRLQRADGRN